MLRALIITVPLASLAGLACRLISRLPDPASAMIVFASLPDHG